MTGSGHFLGDGLSLGLSHQWLYFWSVYYPSTGGSVSSCLFLIDFDYLGRTNNYPSGGSSCVYFLTLGKPNSIKLKTPTMSEVSRAWTIDPWFTVHMATEIMDHKFHRRPPVTMHIVWNWLGTKHSLEISRISNIRRIKPSGVTSHRSFRIKAAPHESTSFYIYHLVI